MLFVDPMLGKEQGCGIAFYCSTLPETILLDPARSTDILYELFRLPRIVALARRNKVLFQTGAREIPVEMALIEALAEVLGPTDVVSLLFAVDKCGD